VNESDQAFFSTAAQVVPILFLAVIWERARTRQRPSLEESNVLRGIAFALLLSEVWALLALAHPKHDPHDVAVAKGVVGIGLIIGAVLMVFKFTSGLRSGSNQRAGAWTGILILFAGAVYYYVL
jgi:hypothetical protein